MAGTSSTTTEETTLIEGMVYLVILVLLMICFNLLIRLARLYAQQRPTYTKPDIEFRNKEKHQNWNWDWVLVFRVQASDEIVTRYQEHYSLRNIVERLNGGGLETKLYKSFDYDKIFCKIRCSLDRLKSQAANIGYPLLMKEAQVRERMTNGVRDDQGIVWKGRQIVDEKHQCPSYEYYEFIYGKYDKREQLQNLYEEYPASNSIFRNVDRLKLIMSVMEADVKDEGCSLKLKDLIAKGAVLAIYPLHDDLQLHALQNQWLSYFTMPWNQPIEAIKDYYGEKVGMYFLFLGHYASWLLLAGAVGLIVFFFENIENPILIWATMFMGIFISLWTTFFLRSWRHTQSTVTMEWGMTGYEELERERTAFVGQVIHSPVDGMSVQYFPPAEKLKRVIMSYLQVSLCMLYVATINAGIFYAYAYISRYPYQNSLAFSIFPKNYNLPLILTFLTIATVTQISNEFFMPYASYLNGIENHRTDTQFEDNLIVKVFLFQFVNSYGALFYITLFRGPIPDEIGLIEPWRTRRFTCRPLCFHEAGALLGTIFLVRVILGNLIEVVVPYLKLRSLNKQHSITDPSEDTNEYDDPFDTSLMRKRQISPAEEQFKKTDYDSISLFNDYAELVIQYGYTTLFVTAFPLAPLFACANNIIEIRVDGWKLTQNTRRPWPSGAEDIGTWEDVLHLMSAVATVTNALIVSFLSPLFDAATTVQRILIFIALEFVLLSLKFAFYTTSEDAPGDVQIQTERQEFYASKIIFNVRDYEFDEIEDDTKENLEDDEPIIYPSDPQVIQPESSESRAGELALVETGGKNDAVVDDDDDED